MNTLGTLLTKQNEARNRLIRAIAIQMIAEDDIKMPKEPTPTGTQHPGNADDLTTIPTEWEDLHSLISHIRVNWDCPAMRTLAIAMREFEARYCPIEFAFETDRLQIGYSDMCTQLEAQVRTTCTECEDGWIEIYPPHGIEAYDGAGGVLTDWIPCPMCNPEGNDEEIENLRIDRQVETGRCSDCGRPVLECLCD